MPDLTKPYVPTEMNQKYGGYSSPFRNINDQIARSMMGVNALRPSLWNSNETLTSSAPTGVMSPSAFMAMLSGR